MTDAELVERLRVWFRLKGDLALREAADRLEQKGVAVAALLAVVRRMDREGGHGIVQHEEMREAISKAEALDN